MICGELKKWLDLAEHKITILLLWMQVRKVFGLLFDLFEKRKYHVCNSLC